jgi:hypothetical protein
MLATQKDDVVLGLGGVACGLGAASTRKAGSWSNRRICTRHITILWSMVVTEITLSGRGSFFLSQSKMRRSSRLSISM